MKKRILSLVICVLSILATMANASAAEFIGKESIVIELPLASDGRICGLLNLSEQPAEGTVAIKTQATQVTGVNQGGTVIRRKAVKFITVADKKITDGLSQVHFNRFVAIEEGIAENVLAETVVAVQQDNGSWVSFCRMTVAGKGEPVAKYYLDNGSAILVVEYDWDSDKELEYCLVAGARGSNGDKPTKPTTPAPEKPATPTPEKPATPAPEKPAVQATPNPQNDEVVLPWGNDNGTTGESTNPVPNPKNDPVTLPWG